MVVMSDFKGCPTSGKIIYNDIVLALKELNAVYDSIYIYIYMKILYMKHMMNYQVQCCMIIIKLPKLNNF